MWPFSKLSKIDDLERKTDRLISKFDSYVSQSQLHRLQDLVCEHRNWQCVGITPNWGKVICADCGKVGSVPCEHVRDRGCQKCVDAFILHMKERTIEPKG